MPIHTTHTNTHFAGENTKPLFSSHLPDIFLFNLPFRFVNSKSGKIERKFKITLRMNFNETEKGITTQMLSIMLSFARCCRFYFSSGYDMTVRTYTHRCQTHIQAVLYDSCEHQSLSLSPLNLSLQWSFVSYVSYRFISFRLLPALLSLRARLNAL